MEVYTLDALFRRQYIIDQFISLIWTERWQTYGDFELDLFSTVQARTILRPGTYLAMNQSNYVMRIESFEDDRNADGGRILKLKGRSMEASLIDRAAKDSTSDLTTSPKWNITDAPAAVGRKIFHDICVTGILDPADVIPGVVEGSFMPSSTIAEPVDPITVNMDPTTVYDAIVNNVLNPWELGMRMLRDDATGLFYFEIYAGSDRTSINPTGLTAVIFSQDLDNLQNTKELTTIDKSKNVAYVFSPAGFEKVYPVDVDPTVEGFERRVLMVDASDITTTSTTDVPSALIQRGKEALAAARTFLGFDGEISQNCPYKYGVDYNLGDLVEEHNDDGVASDMRVTEQIFVSDSQGDRSYPTLVTNITINSGSWMSWTSNKAWFDFDTDATSVWGNQP
jgi:hypothetical protein